MNCTTLILTPKLRAAMKKAGGLLSIKLPDLMLVEIPIEMKRVLHAFLDFDRALVKPELEVARMRR